MMLLELIRRDYRGERAVDLIKAANNGPDAVPAEMRLHLVDATVEGTELAAI